LVILSIFDVQLCSSGDDGGGDRLRLQMQVGYQLLDLTQTVILLLQLMQC
jgi:hypothetical protein